MKQQNDAKSNELKIIRNSYLLIEKKLTLALKKKGKSKPSAICMGPHVGQFLTGTFHFPHVLWQKKEKKTEHLGEHLYVV